MYDGIKNFEILVLLSDSEKTSAEGLAGSSIARPVSSGSDFKALPVADMKLMAKKLRRHIITMVGKAGSGHPGGSLSAVEIITSLYFGLLRHIPE